MGQWVGMCLDTGNLRMFRGADTTGHHCSLLNVVAVIFSGRKCGLRGFLVSFALYNYLLFLLLMYSLSLCNLAFVYQLHCFLI